MPRSVRPEWESLNAEAVCETGRRLGLAHLHVWRLATENIETLTSAMRALPQVLNYNDFHWSNLALSLSRDPLRAVVYDYHLLGVGPRYSDCRNVANSLGEAARSASWQVYGTVDEREALLDEPVSVLYSLFVASTLGSFPNWAKSSLRKVETAELETGIHKALSIL